MQDAFVGLLDALRNALRLAVGQTLGTGPQAIAAVDDSDGFGPVRDAHAVTSLSTTRNAQQDEVHNSRIVDSCMTVLAVVPILQSSSGESTRDRALADLVLESESHEFLTLGPAYCEQVGRRTLNLSTATLKALLEKLMELSKKYSYQGNEETLLLVVNTLDRTSHVWMDPTVATSEAGGRARTFAWETIDRLLERSQRSWRVTDAIIRFLDRYLTKDPSQEIWAMPFQQADSPEEDQFPAAVLPTLGNDDDIRVRFRIAATSPRLLTVGRLAQRDLMYEVYPNIQHNLSTQQDK